MVFAPLYSALLHAGMHSVSSGPPMLIAQDTYLPLHTGWLTVKGLSQQEVVLAFNVLAFNVRGTRLTRGKHRCFREYREWQ